MTRCDGPPGIAQVCPHRPRPNEVQLCNGDLMLCLKCEHVRFSKNSRIQFKQRKTADKKNRRHSTSDIQDGTSTAAEHIPASQLVVKLPETPSNHGEHCIELELCKFNGQDKGDMIRCSLCFRWFHVLCVGLTKNTSELPYCPA